MTRRTVLTILASTLARAAARLPANKNVRWALGSNLWNYFPQVPFTDILDVMRDTGFIGVRVTQFPQILTKYDITAAQLEKEVQKRNLHVITISFNGPAQDPAKRAEIIANAKKAMTFLKIFGADKLVVFSPSRASAQGEGAFKTMCECYNQLGEAAGEMGFRAGLHNHLGQMVQNTDEVDRCMEMTDPKLFYFSPDTAHLYLAKVKVAETLDKYKSRLMMMDYKDAKFGSSNFRENIYDLGDGDVDFPACHRVLKAMSYKGWICVDLDIARQGPRISYERSGAYIVNKLEPIYL